MTKPLIKIITTEDGSHSLLRTDLNETYHSFHGAMGESLHVFIQEGLQYWLQTNAQREVLHVFEVGFGTGLNALLAAKFAEQNQQQIVYHTIEPIPIGEEIFNQLNYGENESEKLLLQNIHQADWDLEVNINSHFEIRKYPTKLESVIVKKKFDVLFFDAFAPSKQAEMWSEENLRKCYELLDQGGILTTYCAQGQFKRNLKSVGFEVQSLPGAMGKKEMVRGLKGSS